MKKLPKVGLLLLVAALVLACGSLAAAQDLIKVGIVNLPPEESGYRQANVEDMNRVFSRENGYDSKQTNTADVNRQMAAAGVHPRRRRLSLISAPCFRVGRRPAGGQESRRRVILFDRLIDTILTTSRLRLFLTWNRRPVGDRLDFEQCSGTAQCHLIRGQMGAPRKSGAAPHCSKPLKKANSTLCGMEQAETPGALRKPAK